MPNSTDNKDSHLYHDKPAIRLLTKKNHLCSLTNFAMVGNLYKFGK